MADTKTETNTMQWYDDQDFQVEANLSGPYIRNMLIERGAKEGRDPVKTKEMADEFLDYNGYGYSVDLPYRKTPLKFWTKDKPEYVKDYILNDARREGYETHKLKFVIDDLKEQHKWEGISTDPIEVEDHNGRKIKFDWDTPHDTLLEKVNKLWASKDGFIRIQSLDTGETFEIPTSETHEGVTDKMDVYVPKASQGMLKNTGYRILSNYEEGDSETMKFLRSAKDAAYKFPVLVESTGYNLALMAGESLEGILGARPVVDEKTGKMVGLKNIFEIDPEVRDKAEKTWNQELMDDLREQSGDMLKDMENPHKRGTTGYWGYQTTMGLMNASLMVGSGFASGSAKAGAAVGGAMAGPQRYTAAGERPAQITPGRWQKAMEALVAGSANYVGAKLPLTSLMSQGGGFFGSMAKAALSAIIGDTAIEESVIMSLDKVTEMTGTNDNQLTLADALSRYGESALQSMLVFGLISGPTHTAVNWGRKGRPTDTPQRAIGVTVSEESPMGVLMTDVHKIDPIEAEFVFKIAEDLSTRGYSDTAISNMPYNAALKAADISPHLTSHLELQQSLIGEADTNPHRLLYNHKQVDADIKTGRYDLVDESVIAGKMGMPDADMKFLQNWRDAMEFSRHRLPFYEGEVKTLKDLKVDFIGEGKKGLRKFMGSATPRQWESFPRQVRQMEDKNNNYNLSKIFVDPVRMAESRGETMRTSIKGNVRAYGDQWKIGSKENIEIGYYAEAQQKGGDRTIFKDKGAEILPKGTKGAQEAAGEAWYRSNIEPLFIKEITDPTTGQKVANPKYSERHAGMYKAYRDHYAKVFDQLNDARILMGKEPLDPVENYFTFMRAMGDQRETSKWEDFSMMSKKDMLQRIKTVEQGYEKHRKGATSPFAYINAQNIFDKYIDSVSESIHKGPIVAKLKTLANVGLDDVPQFQVAALNYLNRQIGLQHKDVYKDPSSGQFTVRENKWSIEGQTARNILSTLRTNVAVATIGASPKSILIQTGAINNTFWKMGALDTYEGILGALDNKQYMEARSRSQALRSRMPEDVLKGEYTDIFRKLEPGAGKKAVALAKGGQMWSMKGLVLMDSYTATAGFLAAEGHYNRIHGDDVKYRGAKGKRQLKADAAKFADDHVIEAHASISDVDLSAMQKTDMGKLMATMQTFTLNNWQYITQDVMGIGMKKTPENYMNVLRFVIGSAASGVLFNDILGIGDPEPQPVRAGLKNMSKGVRTATKAVVYEMSQYLPMFGGKFGGTGSFMVDWYKNAAGNLDKVYGVGELSKAGGVPQSHRTIRTIKGLAGGTMKVTDVYNMWFGENYPGGGVFKGGLGATEKTRKLREIEISPTD